MTRPPCYRRILAAVIESGRDDFSYDNDRDIYLLQRNLPQADITRSSPSGSQH
jgi:hypothetical protein